MIDLNADETAYLLTVVKENVNDLDRAIEQVAGSSDSAFIDFLVGIREERNTLRVKLHVHFNHLRHATIRENVK